MKLIFGFTPAGEEWIDGYDFRQVVEQPAWFGSFGNGMWAGAGEAVPRSVLHEFGHSYWGAFTVSDAPGLSWDTSGGVPQALLQYREQLRLFMLQPPDRFEPLRDRFRNLPGLDAGEYSDLFHFGEADLLYMTGGNLQLVPPLLQPYFSGYLADGGVGARSGRAPQSWDEAISWFNGLSSADRQIAGEVFGLQHFPSGPYADLPQSALSGLDDSVRTAYEGEERQRLDDFAVQFDGILNREFALVDAAGADRGFDFWRSYLSDKLNLHRKYPEVLRGIGTVRAIELARALDLYEQIARDSASEQVRRFRASESQPLVPELAVLLKPRAIVDLFTSPGSDGGIATVLGSRATRLASLVEAVDEVTRIYRTGSVRVAAVSLQEFIRSVPETEFRADAFLLLDLLRSSGDRLAPDVLPQLDDEILKYILRVQPAFARSSEIGPDRLLSAVGISANATLQEIRSGAALLASSSSGNFAIDAPYDEAVFVHLDRFVDSAPAEVLSAVVESGTRLVPWVSRDSNGALRAMRAAPAAAARALAQLSGSRETPWRVIHRVAKEDAGLAAKLTLEIEALSVRSDRVIERAIREFGYDYYWSERNAGPDVEPERFADFVLALEDQLGREKLSEMVRFVAEDIRRDGDVGTVEASALTEFTRTVEAAIDSKSGSDRQRLQELFGDS